MQASKFISMGKTEFHCVVKNNFAVHFELDGSFLLFETSSLPDGVYNQEYELADAEITKFYTRLINEPVQFIDGSTVEQIVWNLLAQYAEEEMSPPTIKDMPKLTKSVADGLTKINEAATFYENQESEVVFVCFGARLPLIDFMSSNDYPAFSCSPLNLYYATNFKGEAHSNVYIDEQVCLFINGDKTCGGIVMGIDMVDFSTFRQSQNN